MALDKNAPEKIKKKQRQQPQEPWLTPGIKCCQKKQKELYKRTLNIPTEMNNESVTMQNVTKCKWYHSITQRFQ